MILSKDEQILYGYGYSITNKCNILALDTDTGKVIREFVGHRNALVKIILSNN